MHISFICTTRSAVSVIFPSPAQVCNIIDAGEVCLELCVSILYSGRLEVFEQTS